MIRPSWVRFGVLNRSNASARISNADVFTDADAFAERGVDVENAWTGHRIASEHAKLIGGRRNERVGVKPAPCGPLAGGKLGVLAGDRIGANENSSAAS